MRYSDRELAPSLTVAVPLPLAAMVPTAVPPAPPLPPVSPLPPSPPFPAVAEEVEVPEPELSILLMGFVVALIHDGEAGLPAGMRAGFQSWFKPSSSTFFLPSLRPQSVIS